MRKIVFTYCLSFLSVFAVAQDKNTKAKDTIKTEVINVVTSYTPTISDAFKVKKNPTIQLGKNAQKRKLTYQIFSAPVASTFVPKKGLVKGINMGVRERLYKNYIAAGYGNFSTPFIETFLNYNTNKTNDFGLYANYLSSENSIDTSPLNSDYSSFIINTYYKQKERLFAWKVGANYKQNSYNWYGLPSSITFTPTTLDAINEQQKYSDFETEAEFIFDDSFISSIQGRLDFFSDDFSSKELRFELKPQFQFSLKKAGKNLNDLIVVTSFDYINGEFAKSYDTNVKLEHSFFTIGVAPKYHFEYADASFKIGAKIYLANDLENKNNQFFVYPDVSISYPVLANYINMTVGVNGDLKTNNYREFSSQNPFVSPTLLVSQTDKKYQVFGGFNGKISSNSNYNFSVNYKNEINKPLFVRNNSKSDGTNATGLLGYEFGNSFSIVYDDVKTLSFIGEIALNVSKNLEVGTNAEFNSYTLTNTAEAWNLPTVTAEIFVNYKEKDWYASATIFTASDRLDVLYSSTYPSTINGIQELNSYVDLNLNGGYHFNDKFTTFLKLNNIFSSDYQQFANFNVQGFQVLAGISYKFDF